MARDVNDAALQAMLAKWRWLVPADVDVRVKFGECDGPYAVSWSVLELGQLLIRVAPPTYSPDLDKEFGIPRDVEADLVHELLHWTFEPFKPERDTPGHRMWEGAVEKIAQWMVKVNRGEMPAALKQRKRPQSN